MAKGDKNAHTFQNDMCRAYQGNILNAACKEDPAGLHKFGATQLDIWTMDEQTGRDLTKMPKFVHGNVLGMPFEDQSFDTIVLGEFLEHCVFAAAKSALLECHRVLLDAGHLIVTFPLDHRPAAVQHAKRLLKVVVEGQTKHDITVWHQTVWEEEKLKSLLDETGWQVVRKDSLYYGFVKTEPQGWGLVLIKKKESKDGQLA